MAKLTLTPQQQAVVENRGGSLLVSAAAGSGKTKVLVDRLFRYVSLPGVQHIVFGRSSKAFDRRETLHESHEVVVALRHARLLQNNLRHPDAVGVVRAAPRKVASVGGVPRFESGGKRMNVVIGHRSGRRNRKMSHAEDGAGRYGQKGYRSMEEADALLL